MDYTPKHKKHIIPNPYDIPVHDQGDKNSCTSHSFALIIEYQLSEKFKERTLVNVEDLWKKQKRFGTATELGDSLEGPWIIAEKYGVKFSRDSGKKGIFFLNGRIIPNKNIRYILHNLENNIRYIFTK